MKKADKKTESSTKQALRKRAEEIARETANVSPGNIDGQSSAEIRQTLHELQVHQIELDMQNEELRRAQVELQAAHDRYFNFYDMAPVGYCTIAKQGLILEANLTIATMLGISRSALIRQPLTPFILKEDQHIYYLHRKQLLETGKQQAYDLRMVKKNGAQFWAHLEATAAQDPSTDSGQANGTDDYRIVLSDITDRKRAEEASCFNSAILSTQMETSIDGILIIDELGKVLSYNRHFVEIWGIPIDALKTKLDEVLQQCVMDKLIDHEEFLNRVKYLYEHKQETSHEEIALKGGNFLDRYSAPMVTPDGTYLGRVWFFRNITDRKRAEEEKQALEERLQRAEKMEALGLLAGGVAHDLNNVLGIVVGYAEMLLNEVAKESPLREDVVTIMDGGQRAAAIVDDMLALARRGVSGRKILNLNKLIGDGEKSPDWKKLLSLHPNVKIHTALEPDILNISGSSVHLTKTLYNLVTNAAEAMTKGGTLTIKTTNQYIDKPIHGYDTIREGDYVVLSVSDTGEGISESDIKRIFEPFYTKKIMGRSGTGLGLSVVWGTVKDHQGYIDVQSEEGKGTTFTLYFQISREDLTTEACSLSMSEYMGKGESILVVDDVKEQRDLASRMLKSLNYNVASAASGEDAVEYLKEHKIDLLVLDMIMDPGMDGLDTYKSVLKINPKQKAIIVSGFSESDRVQDAQVLGAGAYVKKPYVIEKLGLAVKKGLAEK